MADERMTYADDRAVELALRDLAAEIAYPAPSAGFAARVVERLRDESARRRFGRWRVDRRPRVSVAVLLAAALVILVAAIVVAATLGLPGIRIVLVEGPLASPPASLAPSPSVAQPLSPSAEPSVLGDALLLGQPVPPGNLDAAVGRHVLRPTILASPAGAWLETDFGPPIVSLVWPASPSLPDPRPSGSTTDPGIGAVLTELPATIEAPYLEKTIGAGGTIERVTVGGHPGFWISGAPHEIVLLDSNGQPISLTTRLVGSSLLWQQDGLTLRLESGLDRATAIALGASVR